MSRTDCFLLRAVMPLLLWFVCSSAVAQKTPEIPTGTTIKVRMIDKLSSEENQTGDTFHGTLEEPIEVGGKTLYPKGADVMGRVTDVHRSGRLSEPGELDLVLATVGAGNVAESIRVEPLVIKGESHTKSNATKIGGGAVLGAIIGGIAGGGKGAAIGTVAGGAAGTGAAAATGKRAAVVDSEAVLAFTTSATAAALASNSENENSASTGASRAADKKASSSPPATGENSELSPPANYDDSIGLFTLRDRRTIRNCMADHASELPPTATQRPELPAGSERQVRRGEILPSEVQKQAQSLPLQCEEELPKLPPDFERVVYNGRMLLVDAKGRVTDLFYLDETQ
jgi:hypothetical protein